MTMEEAKIVLQEVRFIVNIGKDQHQIAKACEVAIRSLEAWDKVWKDILNHEDVWGTDEILAVLDKHMGEVTP